MADERQIPHTVVKNLQAKEVSRMSLGAVEAVVGKAVVDSEFRIALFADPAQALAGYDLTKEEVAGLKAIDSETLELMASTLDERISKMALPFIDSSPFMLKGLSLRGDGSLLRAGPKGVMVPT